MCSYQRVLFWRLRGSLGVIDVENNITFTNIKIPGDHRSSFHNLNENLERKASGYIRNSSHDRYFYRPRLPSQPSLSALEPAIYISYGTNKGEYL